VLAEPNERGQEEDVLLDRLRLGLKDTGATFKNKEQRELFKTALGRAENCIAILPTGGGKSICFEVPVSSEPTGMCTVVLVPFVSLTQDMLRRGRQLGLRCAQWTIDFKGFEGNQLIFVAVESAVSKTFLRYASYIVAICLVHCASSWVQTYQKKVTRIVFDECHQILVSDFTISQCLGHPHVDNLI
jgi:superfamily II DNA helicase RecQ